MSIPPDNMLMERLRSQDAEVHSLQVSTDRSVLVFDASFPAREAENRNIPVLFALMCIAGGGQIVRSSPNQMMDSIIEPGDIGVAAPSSPGYEITPEMRVIGFGIEVVALVQSFGSNWPVNLRPEVLSNPVRDPMVEATMMQVGYTHAGRISDSVLLHAAHMVAHQLLQTRAEPTTEIEKSDAHPLSIATIDAITKYVNGRIEQTISVEELAREVGISRHHFSRRFRAATGQSPYQFVLELKLDHAAKSLDDNRDTKIIDVANMVGFQNPARFSDAFRRRFGQTPRQWLIGRR